MGIKEILEFFKSFGKLGPILGLVAIFLYLVFKNKWVESLVTKYVDKIGDTFKKKDEKGVKESDIKNHDIFNYIDIWLYTNIPTMEFSTDYRSAVFKKYMTIYFKAYKDLIYNYVTSKAYEKMEDSELWTSIMKLITDIIYKYETDMVLAGLPNIVIEKMKSKNTDTIKLIIELLETICNSQFHNSEKNRMKIYTMMNIMLSILEHTINNCVPVCNSINGQLAGLTYNGFTEPTKTH